jgi:glycosyltransferase involved in cell wall biosynthesis
MSSTRVAIMCSHPIQYQVPWIHGLTNAPGLKVKVYYGLIPTAVQQGGGFGISFAWDIPLLSGYTWEALPSRRNQPDLSSFWSNSTPSVYWRLRADRPHVLILTGWNRLTMVQTWLAGLLLGIPMLIRAESNSMRPRRWWIRILHRIFLRTFKGHLAIGLANRAFYSSNGIPKERIWSAPYFVDNLRIRTDFEAHIARRPELRNMWSIPQDAFCFVYVGKLEPKKRILDLLEALAVVQKCGERTSHLLIVGTGELTGAAKRRVDQDKLPVSFAGFLNQTEIATAYVASDCLVLPSDFGETWGLVVNEAMVCGRPAIVSNRVGCGPDLVAEGETGYVFPFSDVDALAHRMTKMASDPITARAMGDRARVRIQEYSVDAAVAGTRNAIEAITPSAPR